MIRIVDEFATTTENGEQFKQPLTEKTRFGMVAVVYYSKRFLRDVALVDKQSQFRN